MEKKYVPSGVFLTCDKGTLPCQLSVTFNASTEIYGQSLATEADKITGVHVKSMGACAISHGPCIPLPLTWSPVQNDVVVGNNRLLLEDSKLQCSVGGRISIFFSMAAAQAACPTPPPEKSILDQADDYLATLGPAGDYMRFQMGVGEGLFEGGKSMVEGLWGLAKGGWHAATHPVETAEAVGGAASSAWNWASHGDNWANAANSAGQGLEHAADWASHGDNWGKAWDGAADWASKQSPRDWGKLAGRATFEVGMAVGTGGAGEALNVAGKAGEVANIASKASEMANVAEKGAEALNLTEKSLEAANLAEKAAEAGNASGKAQVMGKVTNGAEEAADASRAAREAEEVSQASSKAEAVDGCASESKCTSAGHPVDISNGMVFTRHTDFELPGPIPLVWERKWYSRSQRRGPLGHGWHHRYDMGLVLEDDGRMALRMSDGRLAVFAPTAPGSKSYLRREKLELEHQADGQYRVWDVAARLWYIFAAHAARPEQVLVAVENATGFAIHLTYTATGHLLALTDSAGRRLDFTTDALGRILAISGPDPDQAEARFTLMQYAYDEAGNLAQATDALGHAWHFRYAGHLLTQETNRVGVSFYFTYDSLDHTARCLRTWGDGGIYDTTLHYPAPDHTIVTDSLGAVTQYTHADGVATRLLDALGGITQRVYNKYRELELERDPLDHAFLYDYDQRGNLLQLTYPDKSQESYKYDEHDLLVHMQDVNGGTWQWRYNEAGSLTQRQDPTNALISYAYNAQGQVSSITDAIGHQTHMRYDEAQNLAHMVAPDAGIRSRVYDKLGRLLKTVNALGEKKQFRYNQLGQLTSIQNYDGAIQQLTYNAEGRVVRTQTGQQIVSFVYNAAGLLAQRRQGEQHIELEYDSEGRLTKLINEADETYAFELDRLGQIEVEIGFDGLVRQYTRDGAGRITHVVRPDSFVTEYTLDPRGRVVEVLHNGARHAAFSYRADGTLLTASTDASTVQFERDALGRVLREIQGSHIVESAYDKRGYRLSLASSLGASLALERDHRGSVIGMRTDAWQSVIERDLEGLELQQTMSNQVLTSWKRDALGRPTSQRISVGGRAQRQERQRQYEWQGTYTLQAIRDSLVGDTSYSYSAHGYLEATSYADGESEIRQPDILGNFFRTLDRSDRRYGKGGQLREANGTRYYYDKEGNLTQKVLASGQSWKYIWNAAGQLTSVQRPDGYVVSFTYDALGRRLTKRYRGRVTHWLWDGDKPLHEWNELVIGPEAGSVSETITWLFEQQNFAPTAKLTATAAYSIVTDHLGTPLELYDQQGIKTWQAQFDSYGAVRAGKGKPTDCPFRFQGQYEDVETGLYYNRFRYYDPAMGSYISQDPIRLAGGKRLYGYVKNTNAAFDALGLAERINVGEAGHHVPAVRKSLKRPFEVARSDRTRPTLHFRGDDPAHDHWRLHEAERDYVGPRQGSFNGSDEELFDAYRKAYEPLDDIRVDVRSPNNTHILAEDVSPREAVDHMHNWLKQQGLCPD